MKLSSELLSDSAAASSASMPAEHPGSALVASSKTPQVEHERIGDFFVQSGRLSAADVERIVRTQQERHLRFGDAAMALGLLKEHEVWQALSRQYKYPTAPLDGSLKAYAVVGAPYSREAEAVRQLRTQIILNLDMRHTQSLAVVGSSGGEGKTYMAESLAFAFAQNGQRTLFINANLRQKQKSGLLDGGRQQGLSSVLSGRHSFAQCVAASAFAGLSLLDAGPLPPNPAELLLAPALARVLAEARDQFDIVIVDTPAANRFPDVQLIAQQVSACILVARQHRTSLADLQKTRRLVQVAGGRLLGSIYNGHVS